MEWAQVFAVFVAIVGGSGGVSWYLMRANREKLHAESAKIQAEAADVLVGASSGLVADLQNQLTNLRGRVDQLLADGKNRDVHIDQLEEKVDKLEAENQELREINHLLVSHNGRLRAQIVEAGFDPVPLPEGYKW